MYLSVILVEQIVQLGDVHGLNAADIAERAGIPASALSRARKTGKYNSRTLERLLGAVNATANVVSPGQPQSPLPLIVKKLNAGRKHHFDPDEFRRLIKNFRPSAKTHLAFSHLVGLVEELPIEQLHDLVIAGDTSFRSLNRIVAFVDGEGPLVEWIHERGV